MILAHVDKVQDLKASTKRLIQGRLIYSSESDFGSFFEKITRADLEQREKFLNPQRERKGAASTLKPQSQEPNF